MKLNAMKLIVPAALLGIMALPLAANAQSPYPYPTHHQVSINGRLNNQDRRIDQGFNDHQLTRRENRRLDRRDAQIHRQEARDRRFNDGHLTYGEHRRLEQELNRESGTIYRDRRNGR